jgi:SAM-dependent methyltransferase
VVELTLRERIRNWLSPERFQPAIDTHPNRYPRIFRWVQDALGEAAEADILSFGCSTGEEVFTLRDYFPNARIKGVDINRTSIAEARRRLAERDDAGISFDVASSLTGEADERYDAIFCMAVLRDGRLNRAGVTRSDPLIRFEDFAAAIEEFRRCLKPGGLLSVRYSNFRLCDAPAGAGFETVLSLPLPRGGILPIFGPDNRLIAGADYPDAVFRKT